MKWVVAYLVAGVLLTHAWNIQVQHACGRPMPFAGLVTAPAVMPIFAPFIIWDDMKPTCDRMKLSSRVLLQHSGGEK